MSNKPFSEGYLKNMKRLLNYNEMPYIENFDAISKLWHVILDIKMMKI